MDIACKPSIEEAGIGFDIENKADGENSVCVTDKKTMSYKISGNYDFRLNKQHLNSKHNWISNCNSVACRLLPNSCAYLLALEFESESRVIPQNKIWTANTARYGNVDLENCKQQQQSAMKRLAKHCNIYYDKEQFKQYESIKPLVECFDKKLFQVT